MILRNKKGIIFVAFDLPTETSKDRADYRKFRSYLVKNGYIMFQESLYYKVIRNNLIAFLFVNLDILWYDKQEIYLRKKRSDKNE